MSDVYGSSIDPGIDRHSDLRLLHMRRVYGESFGLGLVFHDTRGVFGGRLDHWWLIFALR